MAKPKKTQRVLATRERNWALVALALFAVALIYVLFSLYPTRYSSSGNFNPPVPTTTNSAAPAK